MVLLVQEVQGHQEVLGGRLVLGILSILGIRELLGDQNIQIVRVVPVVQRPVELVVVVVEEVDNRDNNVWSLLK